MQMNLKVGSLGTTVETKRDASRVALHIRLGMGREHFMCGFG
jgi:hypothetical protein